ncbi:hypothetical protein [Nostoc sp.]|uniref:hypothetical protein n=1 Tax=Nostoc sp. TaxID=1180 RepID=UPI002FFC7437
MTCNRIVSTNNDIASTNNGIVSTNNGIVSTNNGIVSTNNGIVSTNNDIASTNNSIVSTNNAISLVLINISFHHRLKATLVVLLVWGGVSLLHWLPEIQWLMLGLTAILTVQTLRMLVAKPAAAMMESEIYLPSVSI